jgi:leader peptidase (prepilin peptidase)/N-methyltransferase
VAVIEALSGQPLFLDAVVFALGLVLGSFLNVVILRLPRMLEQAWWEEARSVLRLPPRPARERFSLVHPPSRCPSCAAPVRPWQNIPVVSWIALRGRCASCAAPISIQYPAVELLAGVTSGICAVHFGWSIQLAGALVLTWSLIALAVIDLRMQLLPDAITLPLLWCGLLLAAAAAPFADLQSAVFGAIAGYGVLWAVFWAFKLATGKEGMGYGDFKLLGALGAWLGWQALPSIILLSSAVGAAVGIVLIARGRMRRQQPLPFGPFLAAAGWCTLIAGDRLMAYFPHLT